MRVNDLRLLTEDFEQLGESLDYGDLALLSRGLSRLLGIGGGFTPPSYLCRFVAELLASREALSVLDPDAGEGWLAARVTSLGRAATVVAVTGNSMHRGLRKSCNWKG